MKCDLDNMVTYLLRGHLSSKGIPEADVKSVRVSPECSGSGENVGSIRCTDKMGHERELRRLPDMAAVNRLVNDKNELDCLVQDVRRTREI